MSGSISCEAGGGHTASWNIEPDSDARARRRRGGEEDEGAAACAYDDREGTSKDCEYGLMPSASPPAPPLLPELLMRCIKLRLENRSSWSAEAKGGLGKGRSMSSPARNVAREGSRLRESAQ